MTTILALSDTCISDGHLHSMILQLAGEADLVLHAGDFTSQAAYNALKNACKKELWAVYGEKDKNSLGKPFLVDSNKKLLPKSKSGIVDSLKIYLKNNFCKSDVYSEYDLMKDAEDWDVDIMVFGHFNKPIIAWGKKDEASSLSKLLVCPGSSSAFNISHPTVVRINISAGEIKDVELITLPTVEYQNGWRRCDKCMGLFYKYAEKSVCPKGEKHISNIDSVKFSLASGSDASGQRDWRRCINCQSLFFGGNIKTSICPAGGNHVDDEKSRFNIIINNPNAPVQAGWRWCGRCQSLFYGPYAGISKCPAEGNAIHVIGSSSIRSGNYTLESQ